MRQALFCGLLPIWLCACEAFPQLDAVITDEARNADYPKLVPASQLQAYGNGGREFSSRSISQRAESIEDDLVERARRLRQRGDALRQLILDDS